VVARRWCDRLVLEALALNVVSSRGISAAHTNIVETPSHCFLESERAGVLGQDRRPDQPRRAREQDAEVENADAVREQRPEDGKR
jgi:hypothetical protein